MNLSVVLAPGCSTSIVLENIINIQFHSKRHEATIWFNHCGPIGWLISKENLANPESFWTKGIAYMTYDGGVWMMKIDTHLIPINITTL